MKPFDTNKMPWLFTPHGDGELNEYFSTDHMQAQRAVYDTMIYLWKDDE